MRGDIAISDLRFTAAPAAGVDRAGLLGWVRFTLHDQIVIDGVALRRTRDGRLTLSFPVRHDSRGDQHSIVRPIDASARRSIEAQVFAALNLKQESGP